MLEVAPSVGQRWPKTEQQQRSSARPVPSHVRHVVAVPWRRPGRSGQQGEKREVKPLHSLILTLSLCSLPLASSLSGALLAVATTHLHHACATTAAPRSNPSCAYLHHELLYLPDPPLPPFEPW